MLFKNKAVLIVHGFAGGTYDQEYLAKYLELNHHFDVFTFTLPGHDVIINAKVKANEWIDATKREIENLIKVGYKDIYLGVPVILGKNGIEKIVELDLNAEEKEKFAASAKTVKGNVATLKELKLQQKI